jgi:protein-S-isoprenylcysteine O-methyltransferase Ste14
MTTTRVFSVVASRRTSIVVSLLFTVFGGPGLLLVYIPWWMTHFRFPPHEPVWQELIAGLLIALGLIPLFASMLRFITEGRGTLVPAVPTERLVVSGLYRYVRNPMYVGVLTALAGETVLLWTRQMVNYLIVVFILIHLFVVLYEEPTLTHRHPEDYPRYKNNVPRWLPRLMPWHDTGNDSAR